MHARRAVVGMHSSLREAELVAEDLACRWFGCLLPGMYSAFMHA